MPHFTILKLGKQYSYEFDKKLVLGQAPHHGSYHSHKESFWKFRNHDDKCPIAISCGENSYGHPDERVITSFERNKYEIYSTNQVGGLIKRTHPSSKRIGGLLDIISYKTRSNLTASNKYNGPKTFEIKNSTVTIL